MRLRGQHAVERITVASNEIAGDLSVFQRDRERAVVTDLEDLSSIAATGPASGHFRRAAFRVTSHMQTALMNFSA